MTTKRLAFKQRQRAQLQEQLMLAAANPAIQADGRLRRLVRRARLQLHRSDDVDVVAYQIAVDLGYYLFCHQYELPRAGYDLLAVVQSIHAHRLQPGSLVGLPVSES